jgi:hypothetical protein
MHHVDDTKKLKISQKVTPIHEVSIIGNITTFTSIYGMCPILLCKYNKYKSISIQYYNSISARFL